MIYGEFTDDDVRMDDKSLPLLFSFALIIVVFRLALITKGSDQFLGSKK